MAVYISYAALASIAILTVFHGWFAMTKRISVIILDFPTGVLIAAAPILFLALTLVLTGLMLSNPKLRYWTIGLIALLLLKVAHCAHYGILPAPDSFVQGRLPVALLIPMFESAAIILLATALFIRKLRPVTVAALCGGSLLMILGLSAFITLKYDPVFGPGLIVVILVFFVLSLGGAALFTVGLDLAEWSLLLGGFAGDALHPEKWHAGVLLTCVCGATNVALATWALEWAHPAVIAFRGAIILVLTAFLLLVFALRREQHGIHVRYWTLLGLGALLLFSVHMSPFGSKDAPPPVYNCDRHRQFSVIFPEGWEPKKIDDRKEEVASRAVGKGAFVIVAGATPSLARNFTLNSIVPEGDDALPPTALEFAPGKEGGWERFETTVRHSRLKRDIYFVVWHKSTPSAEWSLDTDWYIVGMSHPERLAENMPKLEAVRDSFRLGNRTVPSLAAAIFIYCLWGALAALALFWLLLKRQSRKGPAFALLLGVAGLVLALNAGGLADESLKGFTRTQTFHAAQLVIAALSLLFLLWSRKINRTREFHDQAVHLFLALNICLLLAGGLLTTYHYASSVGEESNTIKGIVVLLVLTLDIFISGHITNRSSRSFPRNSRVLLYLGYILLVGLLVFCFASLTTHLGATRVTAFDSENLVESGILLLGVPFLLVVFARRTTALLLAPKAAAEGSSASLQVDQH